MPGGAWYLPLLDFRPPHTAHRRRAHNEHAGRTDHAGGDDAFLTHLNTTMREKIIDRFSGQVRATLRGELIEMINGRLQAVLERDLNRLIEESLEGYMRKDGP